MLIAFHSKAAPEVLMLAKHALPLLAAAGKVGPDQSPLPERGVFTVEQLDATIAGIEQATGVNPAGFLILKRVALAAAFAVEVEDQCDKKAEKQQESEFGSIE